MVDENDNVIGETVRGKSDVDPKLIHREISVILFDEDRKILISQRSWKKKSGPGMWTLSCGGHVSKGEDPGECARREVQEELGIDIDLIFLQKELVKAKTETHFTYRYIGKYEGQKIMLKDDEVMATRLATENEVDEIFNAGNMAPKSYEVMKRFWKRMNKVK